MNLTVKKSWLVNNVPDEAVRLIKSYAAKQGVSIGVALLLMAREVNEK
jgi:hypothetical protein